MNKLNKTILSNENGRKSASGITLIALVITIIVLLILAGITIAMLTGSDSAPAKANEAKQKNDIGSARDQVYLFASNAQTEAYERIYVKGKQATSNADVTAGNASTEVSNYVKNLLKTEYPEDGTKKVGLATIVATDGGATITISTTDWKQEGNVENTGGTLTWKELTENTPQVQVELPSIGSEVNYTTYLNEVELSDWKVFYTEDNYIYLILADYLPNEAVSLSGLTKYGTYGIGLEYDNSKVFIDKMTNTANWSNLLIGSLNGTDINLSSNPNVWAMGAPTVELFLDSWNKSYPNNKLYSNYDLSDDVKWYYFGTTPNPEVDSMIGPLNMYELNNTLYAPHESYIDDWCYGYWLAAGYYSGNICNVRMEDWDSNDSSTSSAYAFRPVIKLPASLFAQ